MFSTLLPASAPSQILHLLLHPKAALSPNTCPLLRSISSLFTNPSRPKICQSKHASRVVSRGQARGSRPRLPEESGVTRCGDSRLCGSGDRHESRAPSVSSELWPGPFECCHPCKSAVTFRATRPPGATCDPSTTVPCPVVHHILCSSCFTTISLKQYLLPILLLTTPSHPLSTHSQVPQRWWSTTRA